MRQLQKILICMTTGRKNFKETLGMFEENMLQNKIFEKYEVTLGINYDTSFKGLSPVDFTYTSENDVRIVYFDSKFQESYEGLLSKYVNNEEIIDTISQKNGYGSKKNLILIYAAQNNYDNLIFLDDDELPTVSFGDKKNLHWESTNNIDALCSCNNGEYDISIGFLSGYDTTIPPLIHQYLGIELAQKLGGILSIGSDVITQDSFIDNERFFLTPQNVPREIEVESEEGGKWFGGGNICFNVNSIKKGILPAYYTPLNGRGEDTIFSMKLEGVRVWRAKSGIFHDAFLEYISKLENGNLPMKQLEPSEADREFHVIRFGEALYGWLAYTPLFLALKEKECYEEKTREMIKQLETIDSVLFEKVPEIKKKFGDKNPSEILKKYLGSAVKQVRRMNEADLAFKSICLKI